MAIHRVILNKESGGVDDNGENYTVVYHVITDKGDSPSLLLEYAEQKRYDKGWRLPVKGDAYVPGGRRNSKSTLLVTSSPSEYSDDDSGEESSAGSGFYKELSFKEAEDARPAFVSTIAIERDNDDNFKSNGLGLPVGGSYTAWNYTATYGVHTTDLNSASASIEGEWSSSSAENISLETVSYDLYTNICYNPDKDKELTKPSMLLYNSCRDPMYVNRKIFNLLLNFSFNTSSIHPNAVFFTSSLNKKPMTIAGMSIGAGKAKLLKYNISVVRGNNNKTYRKVDVSIEIEVQKPVGYQEVLSRGTRAYITTPKGRFRCNIQQTNTPSVYLADKKNYPYATLVDASRNLGFFDNSLAGQSLNISEPVPLTAAGEIAIGATVEELNKNTAKIKAVESLIRDWSCLKLPKSGL